MTVTADINTLTGSTYTGTEVTAAIAVATTIINSETGETYVEDTWEKLDSACVLLARRSLIMNRNAKKTKLVAGAVTPLDDLITPEIRKLLNDYLDPKPVTVYTFFKDFTPPMSSRWRS